ncbi:hypothetical protein [Pseudomonas koreensis]|uniref:hypothetical protein n=1 Tax=Pseudomonas koreensis TaxID=198620 RepID=UPI00078C9880|nr:hypothetical protein [Pseudomonas koreensis]AMT89863.1 hypothetical protein AYO71_20800 [Pseudomonas koreensis]
MPTGYTDEIKKGISFSTFAMNCARAFGATITLRDESGGGDKIPQRFEPDSYHSKALNSDRENLAALESMTLAECELKAAAEHTASEVQRLEWIKERNDLRQSYEEMLRCAQSWVPPTEEHIGLKEFMIQQITDSIKWDCDISYYATPTPVLTGLEWLEAAKEKTITSMAYHKKGYSEEVARTEQRNAWISALRASL